MTVTTTSLTRAAGLSAAVAGLIFISVQINHPPMDVSSVTTTDWVVRSIAKFVMSGLVLAGITGMYLRQVRQIGILGLIGYLVFSAGYLIQVGIEFLAAFVLPSLADTAPGYVNDVLTAAAGGAPTGDIGLMQPVLAASGVGYLAGGVLFGVALFRARVLARWAAALLVVGTVATLALAVLPESFNRPIAIPTGVAFIGLGISLWRDQRRARTDVPDRTTVARQPAVR
ncbi:MAG TPA: hypothetical protein VFI00_12240 [Kribbella sp.]|nr:hypothetical protein [Kribbella sp.]